MKYWDVFFGLFFLCYALWILSLRIRSGSVTIKLTSSSRKIGLIIGIFAMVVALHNLILPPNGSSSNPFSNINTMLLGLVVVLQNALSPSLCRRGIFLNTAFVPWSRIRSAKWDSERKNLLRIGVDHVKWWDNLNTGEKITLDVWRVNHEVVENLIRQNVPTDVNIFAGLAEKSEVTSDRKMAPIIAIWGTWAFLIVALIYASTQSVTFFQTRRSIVSTMAMPGDTPQSLHLDR